MRTRIRVGVGLLLTGVALWAQQYLITPVAGGGLPATPAPALSAPFTVGEFVAVDAIGNVYFGGLYSTGDNSSNMVFKLDGGGILTRVAGNGTVGSSGDGGPATSAQLGSPQGVAVDIAGDVYIADPSASGIRRVSPDGTITQVADVRAQGLALDAAGNLYYTDWSDVVRKLAPDGTFSQISIAEQPGSIAVDASGNVYIAVRFGSRVRKVATDGTITTVAGNGTLGYSGDGGPAVDAQICCALGLAADASGNLYLADTGNYRVRKVAADGTITTVAGNGTPGYSGDGGPATSAQLSRPTGLAVDSAGTLYLADNGSLRKVTPDGTITTVAGGTGTDAGDGGPATRAQLNQPLRVALDAAGNLYIADSGNNKVRKVTGDGTITTAVATAQPEAVAVDSSGNLYIGNRVQNEPGSGYYDGAYTIQKLTPQGAISDFSGDMAFLGHMAVDAAGNLYAAVYPPSQVYKMTPGGPFTVVAGVNIACMRDARGGPVGYPPGPDGFGDGGPAIHALLCARDVALDATGSIYIADENAYWKYTPTHGGPYDPYDYTYYARDGIRKVAQDGTISTVVGPLSYSVSSPALDPAGNLYYLSGGDVMAGGSIIANGLTGSSLTADARGGVYVANYYRNVVLLLVPQGTRAVLSVSSAHSGYFTPAQKGATFSVLVSNAAGAGPTAGAVTVREKVSLGLTLLSMSGSGWNCSGNACTRNDLLPPGLSYPPIAVAVGVAADAPSQVTNEVAVSGGDSPAAAAGDMAVVILPPPAPVLVSPANGATGILLAPVLSWGATFGSFSYDVYFGTSSAPPLVATTAGTSFAPGILSPGATYYWRIAAQNTSGSASSATGSFTTAAVRGLRFVPVTPCRVADTRNPAGPFGGPGVGAGLVRSFAIPQGGCGIPDTAQVYSLNVTVVPKGTLEYLTLWPAGQVQPFVSTLNSWGGEVAANAAIVPAGSGGAVSVFASGLTDVILDIDGYFDTSVGANSFAFYAAAPCRVADTRGTGGISGGQSRDFAVSSGSCGIPAGAGAYSLNVTAVPDPALEYLGFLTAWPAGRAQPFVSTLNSWTGKVVANAAVVPAGSGGSISVYVTEPANVILDTNGYFAAPGRADALTFYPVTPCRVADTRRADGPFGGPILPAGTTRSFTIPAGACSVPATAAAYSLNVTVVPSGLLSYLTTWPTGSGQPFVSTLNSFDGSVVANAAIVPAGMGGAISVYVTDPTHVILDINGYFAP